MHKRNSLPEFTANVNKRVQNCRGTQSDYTNQPFSVNKTQLHSKTTNENKNTKNYDFGNLSRRHWKICKFSVLPFQNKNHLKRSESIFINNLSPSTKFKNYDYIYCNANKHELYKCNPLPPICNVAQSDDERNKHKKNQDNKILVKNRSFSYDKKFPKIRRKTNSTETSTEISDSSLSSPKNSFRTFKRIHYRNNRWNNEYGHRHSEHDCDCSKYSLNSDESRRNSEVDETHSEDVIMNLSFPELKKNRRLFPKGLLFSSADDDDDNDNKEKNKTSESRVISSAVMCPYCRERDPGFVNADCLKLHYAYSCMTLCRCDFCDKIVEVADLNNHQLNRCLFVRENLEECDHCGLARFVGQSTHPKCRMTRAAIGSAWCPLCSALIGENTSRYWRKHLINDCYNNSRNDRWPKIRDGIQMGTDIDKRGEELLTNLYKDNQRNKKRGQYFPINTFSNDTTTQLFNCDLSQLRNAIRRLNREYRSGNRPMSNGPVSSQRIIHHDDSD